MGINYDQFILPKLQKIVSSHSKRFRIYGRQEMIDHKIELDSPFAQKIGFTSGKFFGWLWRKGNVIYISFIESKHESQGNFRELIKNINDKGFTIKVPTPFPKMEEICKRLGFIHKIEKDEFFGQVEIMELKGD